MAARDRVGSFDEALDCFSRVVELRKEECGEASVDTAAALRDVGRVLVSIEQYVGVASLALCGRDVAASSVSGRWQVRRCSGSV